MVHLAPVAAEVTADDSAELFLNLVFRHHGLSDSIVSDRDPRFTSAFWTGLFELLGTRLLMSTAAHPETDGQTERVNRVLEDVLRSYATSFTSWSSFLLMAEFALNNATHSSTGLTPFFVPALLAVRSSGESVGSTLGGGEQVPTSQSVQTSSKTPPVQGHALHCVTFDDSCADDAAQPVASTSSIANFAPKEAKTQLRLQQYPTSCSIAKPSRGLFVTRSKLLLINREQTQIDKAGIICLPSGKAREFYCLLKGLRTQQLRSWALTNVRHASLDHLILLKLLVVPPTRIPTAPDVLRRAPEAVVPATIPALEPTHQQRARIRKDPVDAAGAESSRDLAPRAKVQLHETLHRQASPNDAAVSSPHGGQTPTELLRTRQQQQARTQHHQGAPPPSRFPSLRLSRHSQADTARPSAAPSHPPRSHANLQQPEYRLEGSPLLVDASSAQRWIVERLVDHDMRLSHKTPHDATGASRTRSKTRRSPEKYQVRWLGHSPKDDTWEPRSSLLKDIPDVVNDYEASAQVNASSHVDAPYFIRDRTNGLATDSECNRNETSDPTQAAALPAAARRRSIATADITGILDIAGIEPAIFSVDPEYSDWTNGPLSPE